MEKNTEKTILGLPEGLYVILCLSEDILNLDTLLIVEAWWPHG